MHLHTTKRDHNITKSTQNHHIRTERSDSENTDEKKRHHHRINEEAVGIEGRRGQTLGERLLEVAGGAIGLDGDDDVDGVDDPGDVAEDREEQGDQELALQGEI